MQNIPRPSNERKSKKSVIFNPYHSSLQAALNSDVHKSIIPFKKIAQALGMSTGRLASYLSSSTLNKPFKFSAKHLLTIMLETQSFNTLAFLAANTGHAVIKIPDKKPNPERLVPVILDFSDTREELEKALNFYLHTGEHDSLKKISDITWKLINICAEMRVIAEKLDHQLRGKS